MKINFLMVFLLASFFCISSCNNDKTTDPARSLLGERTCSGTIIQLPTPPSNDGITLPGMILGLKTATEEYILTCDGSWQTGGVIMLEGEKTYISEGNGAKITGIASKVQLSSSQTYLELEIKTINEISIACHKMKTKE